MGWLNFIAALPPPHMSDDAVVGWRRQLFTKAAEATVLRSSVAHLRRGTGEGAEACMGSGMLT